MENKTNIAVFFDPERKRWPKIKGSFLALAITLLVIFVVFIVSVFINSSLQTFALPALNIGSGKKGLVITPDSLQQKQKEAKDKQTLLNLIAKNKQRVNTKPQLTQSAGQMLSVGFVVDWDDASFGSLRQNLSSLDVVIGAWLHLDTKGQIVEDDVNRQQAQADYIRANKPSAKIIPLINNFINDNWDDKTLAKILADDKASTALVEQLTKYCQDKKFNGVSIDFENISDASQIDFVKFLAKLRQSFQVQGLKIYTNVPADNGSFDYAKIAELSDYVIVMAYDQHWATGDAGAIADQTWFEEVVTARAVDIPKEKLIVALASYGYDWQTGSKAPAKAMSFEEAIITAQESSAQLAFDGDSLNPTYGYVDEHEKTHSVWLLDATTAYNQKQVVQKIGARGIALWRLGTEDPSLWSFFAVDNRSFDDSLQNELKATVFNHDVQYEGEGEILRAKSDLDTGERIVKYDKQQGLIIDENFTRYPHPYVFDRYGGQLKAIALTFDDGPDPVWTTAILDILEQTKTPATFFVIGANAEKYPAILQREYALGNDIGNHTFTHPNIAKISDLQLRLEMSATQRLLESYLGHGTHLFRPPYSEDSEPDNAAQAKPIVRLSQEGYVTVGIKIDPNDWRQPGTDKIVSEIIRQAEAGFGNVVLLHDSGGDRTQTVAALPEIIRQLRAKGYKLVTVSELMKQPRELLMPVAQAGLERSSDYIGFRLVGGVLVVLTWLFFIAVVLGLLRFIVILILAVWNRFSRQTELALSRGLEHATAVIVPAYNEEKVVAKTIYSLLAADIPKHFEIIAVDDGSKDSTYQVLLDNFGSNPRVKILTQTNSGKNAALNYGISQTQAEIIIVLDADTVFAKDTVLQLVKHFDDPQIGAVAGNAKVGNRINWLTQWQALEYITSQNIDRRAFELVNSITVVPGAVGAWRRELIISLGGFEANTLAEDADLTVKIIRAGFKVIYEDKAYALTEAPDTVSAFIKQRYRWMFGTFQVAWKNKEALFRPREKFFGMFTLPNIFVYQLLFPLLSPIADLTLVLSLITAALKYGQHPASYNFADLQQILLYYAVFAAADFLTAVLAFILEPKEDKRLLLWIVPQRIVYRQLIYITAIKTIIASLRGHEVGWNKLERKATVK